MPPKAKFTKEQVVQAAMALIREGSPVTARELGARSEERRVGKECM